jgi:transcription elongation factor GreA
VAAVFLTSKGYEHLHAELRELIEVRRPQVMADLTQAREYGDISENAEYETAKRDQGLIEGRIRELEGMLSSVGILEIPTHIDEVVIGARVKVENLDAHQERNYMLVSEQESHLSPDYLSITSPLGKALIGAHIGDTITFQAPAGPRRFKLLELRGADGAAE